MTERLKVTDCKSVRFLPIVGSNPTLFISISEKNTKYNAVGSVPVLGTGSHGFKSRCFETYLTTKKLEIVDHFSIFLKMFFKIRTFLIYLKLNKVFT